MELAREWVSYDGPAGAISAYLARPRPGGTPRPAVLVLQEVWGVDGHIEDVTDRLASAGYVALAVDLYSSGGGRPAALAAGRVEAAKAFLNTIPSKQWAAVLGDDARRTEELAKLPEGEGQRVGETMGTLFGGMRDMAPYLAMLRAAVAYLHTHPACAGRAIGSIGFCMGGGLSALLACEEPQLAAVAVFYGSSPNAEQVASIGCPVRGFYGREDPRILAGLPDFEAALRSAGADYELRVYPDTPHAFFNDTRPSYRPEAARDAWARALAFFAHTLEAVPTLSVQEAASDG